MNTLYRIFFFFFFLLSFNIELSAKNYLDSLKHELNYAKNINDRYELFCSLGITYAYTNVNIYVNKANMYFDSAFVLANKMNSNKRKFHVDLLRTYLLPKDNINQIYIKRKTLIYFANEAKKNKYDKDAAYALLQLGYLNITIDSPSAQNEINSSIEIYSRLNDSIGIAVCQSILAELFLRKGYLNDAMITAEKADVVFTKNYRSIDLFHFRIFNYLSFADLYNRLGNYNKSIFFLERAENSSLITDSVTYVHTIYVKRSYVFLQYKKYDSALSVLKKDYNYINKYSIKELLSGYYYQIADIYLKWGYLKRSQKYIDKSFSEICNIKRTFEKCLALLNISNYYLQTDNYNKSIATTKLALPIAEVEKQEALILDSYYLLFTNYKMIGDYKNAYSFLEKYNNRLIIKIGHDKERQITKLQLQKDFELKEHQNQINYYKLKQAALAKSKKDNQLFFIFVSCIFLLLLGVLMLIIQQLRYKNKFRKDLAEQHQNFALSVIAAQEEERKKIAQDIHDGLGAYLSSLRINLSVIKKDIPEKSQYLANNMMAAIGKINSEVKSIADFLVSDTLQKYGLIIAIEELVEIINASNKVKVVFNTEGEFGIICYNTQLSIFRVVQELLNNLLKHSDASNCSISIKNAESIIVNYQDDGVGIHDKNSLNPFGHGFKNMQNRIRILGGVLDIKSASNDTLAIFIDIPNKI